MKKRMALVIVTAMLLAYFSVPCRADEPQKVRVGFYDFPYFQEIDEYGNYSGYSYEYLQAIAQYTGWEYEYVTYATSSECLELLRKGEIDLMGVVQRTPEREAVYDYPELNSGYSSSLLVTDQNDLRYAYEDFASFDGMTVGIQKSFSRNQSLTDYCSENGFSIQTVTFDTKEAILDALSSGAIDAALISSNQNSPDYRVIAKFAPSEVYYVTTKGNKRVLDGLNDALERLKLETPSFDTELYKKYYNFSEGQAAVLSKAERAYVDEHPSLTVLYDPNRPPFEVQDDTGEASGISIDIMKRISKAVGIAFQYVPIQKTDGTEPAETEQAHDLFSAIVYDYNWANRHHALITQPYLDVDCVTIYKKSKQGEMRIALLKDAYLTELIAKKTEKFGAVTYYDTMEECLDAVDRGDADYTVSNTYECEYFLSQARYHALNFQNLQVASQQLSIGISRDADPLLYSIMTKGLQSISGDELASIIRAHISHSGGTNFIDMLYTNPKQFALISSAIALLFTGLIFSLILYGVNRKKQRLLENAISVKSQFLSSMSHDMRTPMNAIIGMSYLGMESTELTEAKEYHRQINRSGEYLLRLINDTLDMSKIEQDKMYLNPEPYNSADFVESIVSMMQKKADDKGVHFIVEVPPNTTHTAVLDKLRLQQIFINLINNAIKFTPPGGTVRLIVEVDTASPGAINIRFTVRDNGIGMSEAFQKKMFLPFEQEAAANTTDESGTGLGLAIVQKLVHLMGGEITCRSELGKGTEFVVTLQAPVVPYRPAPPKQTTAEKTDSHCLRGKRILLAEDHPLNVLISTKLLEKMEITVEPAENGVSAVDRFKRSPAYYYDAILMDIRMPVMDGLEATREIRALMRADAKTVPIVAMTANAFAEDVAKSRDAGMNAHLSKPIEPEALYSILLELLSGGKDA